MPRSIPQALLDHLRGDSLTVALCVRIARTDGVIFGFTSHDRQIALDGLTYEVSDGLSAGSMRQTTGDTVDNMEVYGALNDDRITETDLAAGRYRGAEVLVQLVNWASPADGAVILSRGVIGEITISGGAYKAEVRGLCQRLRQTVGDLTSPLCRCARLGDAQCKAPMSARTASVTVLSRDASSITFGPDSHMNGEFQYGVLTFTSGPNAGLSREVKTHTHEGGARVTLRTPFPLPISVGDAATLSEGCDRRWVTCSQRFTNGASFHGEPYLPGNDTVLQVGRGTR